MSVEDTESLIIPPCKITTYHLLSAGSLRCFGNLPAEERRERHLSGGAADLCYNAKNNMGATTGYELHPAKSSAHHCLWPSPPSPHLKWEQMNTKFQWQFYMFKLVHHSFSNSTCSGYSAAISSSIHIHSVYCVCVSYHAHRDRKRDALWRTVCGSVSRWPSMGSPAIQVCHSSAAHVMQLNWCWQVTLGRAAASHPWCTSQRTTSDLSISLPVWPATQAACDVHGIPKHTER